jgi:hypothetical protein
MAWRGPECASFTLARPWFAPKSSPARKRKAPSSRITSIGPSRSRTSRRTGYWHCGAGRVPRSRHVSALGPQLAANIVAYRNQNGPFRSRAKLRKVPRLGPKAFEQADGLVHVSQLADHFVKNPADLVKVHQHVTVTVTEVDVPRKRIGLSMKSQPDVGTARPAGPRSQPARKPSPAPANDWFSQALARAKGRTGS